MSRGDGGGGIVMRLVIETKVLFKKSEEKKTQEHSDFFFRPFTFPLLDRFVPQYSPPAQEMTSKASLFAARICSSEPVRGGFCVFCVFTKGA